MCHGLSVCIFHNTSGFQALEVDLNVIIMVTKYKFIHCNNFKVTGGECDWETVSYEDLIKLTRVQNWTANSAKDKKEGVTLWFSLSFKAAVADKEIKHFILIRIK